jgi:hypothetical protein
MKNNFRLKYCVFINFLLFIFIVITVVIFNNNNNNNYFKYGPNDDLDILGIKINTIDKYLYLQLFLCFVEISRAWTNEIASPILGFNIYNPDKKIIKEFTKNELQLLANIMWLINSLTNALFILITISQIDIAILRILYSEITTIFTIRLLLNDKTFIVENDETFIVDSFISKL